MFSLEFSVIHQKPVFGPKTPYGRCGCVAIPKPHSLGNSYVTPERSRIARQHGSLDSKKHAGTIHDTVLSALSDCHDKYCFEKMDVPWLRVLCIEVVPLVSLATFYGKRHVK